jgi:hypothetical protein
LLVRLFLVAILAALFPALGATPVDQSLVAEIATIDAVTAGPDRKMVILEAMAVRLGTHRNHLLLLRRQSGESFGQIFVSLLEAKGRTPAQIDAELKTVIGETSQQLRLVGDAQQTGSQSARPILYLGNGVDHNSSGTFFTLAPEVGIESQHFTLVGGVPYFRNSGSDTSSSGVGDAYVSGLLRGMAARMDLGANLVVGFPTGDEENGLGAGKVTMDASGLLQKRFERFRPFVKGGVANYIFNNVGYQRPYISTGNAVYLSGGVDFRAHDHVVLGAGGFAVHPWGDQNVQPRMSMHGSSAGGTGGMSGNSGSSMSGGMPGGMSGGGTGSGIDMPGMGGSAGDGAPQAGQPFRTNMPFLSTSQQSMVPAEDLQDYGAVGWASFELHPGITLNFSVARSIPFELTTVGVGLGFDFVRLFLPGKRF